MRGAYLCLDTVSAAPYQDRYADGYIVTCRHCMWRSAVFEERQQAESVQVILADLADADNGCALHVYPTVGDDIFFVVNRADVMVVWRADAPGLEPRKIALTNADFAKMYGKAE